MARMPGAVWLGEQSPRRPMARYDIVCIHTIVGWAPAHAAHFSVKLDGTILQSRDTAFQSAGNLDGNPRVLVIENEDGGRDIPLTAAQVEANAQILAWSHQKHGVPLQLCPDSRAGSRGLAVHRQGIDGNFTLPSRTRGLPRSMWLGRVAGGEHWSTSAGKICPRDNKIAQVPSVLARAKDIAEGDDMANHADQLNRIEAFAKKAAEEAERARKGSFKRDQRLIKKVTGVDVDLERVEKAVKELDES